MRVQEPTEWVVYRTASRNQVEGQSAICSQQEWNAMESATPGVNVLIQEHITNEATAERLARSLIVPAPPKPARKPTVAKPPLAPILPPALNTEISTGLANS